MRDTQMMIYMPIMTWMYYLYISGCKCFLLFRIFLSHEENMRLFAFTKNAIHLDTKMSSAFLSIEYIHTEIAMLRYMVHQPLETPF